MRSWANQVQAFYGPLTISPQVGVGVTINAPSATGGITVNGADIGAITINSGINTSRSVLSIQQAGTATARIGSDGTQSMLSDSNNGDLCFITFGSSFRWG